MMKRTVSTLIAIAIATGLATIPLAANAGSELHVSDDGLVTVAIPPEALAPDTPVSIVLRDSRELPGDELGGIDIRGGFYDLAAGTDPFATPVFVTRTVKLGEIGFDPAAVGIPIIPLAQRNMDATWRWLDDQVVAFDLDAGTMTVSGLATQPGAIQGFGGTAFVDVRTIEPSDGSSARVPLQLNQPRGLDARLGQPTTTSYGPAAGIRTLGAGSDEAAAVRFECRQSGPAPIGVILPIDGIGGGLPLFDDLGLGPASVDLLITATANCDPPAARATISGPRAVPADARFTSLLPNGVDYEEEVRFLLDPEQGSYDRLRLRPGQEFRRIVVGDDGVAWFVAQGPGFREVIALRAVRPGLIEGVSNGGSRELFDGVATLRPILRGVDGHPLIDRAASGRRLGGASLRELGLRPREAGFQHAIRIRLDRDSRHPADVLLGTDAPPAVGVPEPPGAWLGVFDAETARWWSFPFPGGDPLPPFEFGDRGGQPLVGDFDGDGTPGPATYDPDTNRLVIRDRFLPGSPDRTLRLADASGVPLVGDFDGDGIDDLGIWEPDQRRFSAFDVSGGAVEAPILRQVFDELDLGPASGFVVGDFDGDGVPAPGVRDGDVLRWGESFDDLDLDAGRLDLGPLLTGVFESGEFLVGDFGDLGRDVPAVFDQASGTLRIAQPNGGSTAIDGFSDQNIFADGFESGDTSAWSYTVR